MKTIKLNKKLLNGDLENLLVTLGAADLEKQKAFPQHVYFSKQDQKTLKSNLTKLVKKESSYATKRRIDLTVGYELLNLGPSSLLEDAIKPGYAIVDSEAIENESNS